MLMCTGMSNLITDGCTYHAELVCHDFDHSHLNQVVLACPLNYMINKGNDVYIFVQHGECVDMANTH